MSQADHTSRRARWLGILALLVTVGLWSLNGPLIKLLDEAGVEGLAIACYRSLLGGVVFLPFAVRRWRTLGRVDIRWPIGSVLAFTLMTVCFVVATTQTAAANAIILQNTSPVWVFLLAPLLLRERLRLTDGAVLLFAMIGVAIIFFGHATTDVPALVTSLASGVGYGSLIVALRGLRQVNPSTVVSLNLLGSGLLLVPAVGLWATFSLDAHQFGLVVVLGVVQLALPYMIFSWAIRHVEAHQAALIVLLEAVLNPLWTYLVVGESVPTPTLIGGPLILVSVVAWMFVTWRRESRSTDD